MALKDTMKRMQTLIESLAKDLKKAEKGNKAASQRVRTGSIKFAKLSKLYRKESMKSEKGSKRKTTRKKTTRKTTRKKKSERQIIVTVKRFLNFEILVPL